MPSGKTHEAATLLVLTPAAGYLYLHDPLLAAGVALGAVASFWVNPDLDLAYSRPSRRWGPLNALWGPYRLLFPHRSASHSWLVGPLSRLLYLALPFFAAKKLGLEPPPVLLPKKVLVGALGGWLASEWLHLALDKIPPWRLVK